MSNVLTSLEPTESLITLARRYCMENHEFWCEEYTKKRTGNNYPYTYTDGDYDLFPRYNVLNAVLLEVETLTGGEFSSLSHCRELLMLAGQIGETVSTMGEQNEIVLRAMTDERNKFVAYIRDVTEADLQKVEPLPYARHLNTIESANIQKRLLRQWNFDGGYWEPSVSRSLKLLFLAMENITDNDDKQIKDFIMNHAASRLYRITEFRVDYQIESVLLDIKYRGSDTIFCDDNYDWIIHVSHDRIVTFGGDALVAFIRRIYGERMELIDAMPKW